MQTLFRFSVVVALAIASVALALDLGDRAPSLDGVTVWLNGDAVDPSRPSKGTRYVVELWATWCPPCRATAPHLAALHNEFKDRGVVIIGLTDDDEAKVRAFVESAKLPYRIAIDSKKATAGTWMKGVEGIPHAFVVDTNGVVAWSGHPMDGLREVLSDLLAGVYDPARRKAREELQERLGAALQNQDLKGALKIADEILTAEPRRMDVHQLRIGLLAQLEDHEGAKAHQRKLLEIFDDSAKDLNDLAWALAAPSPLPVEMRDLEVAVLAARRAMELTDQKDPAVLDTWAMALHAVGLTEWALEVQERAMAIAKDDESRRMLSANRDYFLGAIRAKKIAAKAPAPAIAPKADPAPAPSGDP